MKKISLQKTLCLTLSLLLLCAAFTGCAKKSVKSTSYIDGTDSEYVVEWEEEQEPGKNSVLTSGSSTASGGASSGKTSSVKQSDVVTPTVNFDVYKNIPKNVKQIKVLLWYTPDDAEQAMIDAFEKKFGIKVKLICTDNAGYLTKLTTLVASKSAPDVAMLYDFPAPVIKGLFEEIDTVSAAKGGAFDFEKDSAIDMNAVKLASWKGKRYGVNLKGNWQCDRPMVVVNRTLFHNKGVTDPYTLWKSGKWNWSSFTDCAEKMTYKNNGIQVYGAGSGDDISMIYQLVSSTGTSMITINNADGNITNNFSNANVLKALSLVTKIRNSGWCTPRGSTWNMFTNGQCAMFLSGASVVKKGREFTSMKDDWTAVPIPCPDGQEIITPYSTNAFGIPKGAKNGIAGSYFLRYFLDGNNMNIRNTFLNEETYKTWLKQATYKTCYSNISPILSQSAGLQDKIVSVTWGSENDVATGIKALSGSADNAIKTIIDEMSTK